MREAFFAAESESPGWNTLTRHSCRVGKPQTCMLLLSTPPTPLCFLAIFPLDGLLSNPQTLCACVSISSVAWRPFHSP